MYFDEHNFLSESDLEAINKRVTAFYKLAKEEHCVETNITDNFTPEQGRYTPNLAEQKAYRVRFWTHTVDADKDYLGFFGNQIKPLLDKTRNYLIDKGFKNIKLSNVWLQYGDVNTKMDRHTDGYIKTSPPEKCFTSLYFCHQNWDDNWGGIFKIATQLEPEIVADFSPTPNRFVIWTREHHHWMTPITEVCPLRMFVGTSWYE